MPAGGYIHAIIGPMFSGKTSFLLHQLERFSRSGKRVVLISADTRSSSLVTHSGRVPYEGVDLIKTDSNQDIEETSERYDVLGIDEVQFFGEELVPVLTELADAGKIVLASGLDQDFRKEAFGTTLKLLAESEKITRLTSVCQRCGSDLAIRNLRTVGSTERVLQGGEEAYSVYCRVCDKIVRQSSSAPLFRAEE